MIVVSLILGIIAALLQAGVVPEFAHGVWVLPLPVCALVAAWGATRQPHETWTIVVPAALLLGVLSIERSGWFLLALLPVVGTAMLLAAVSPRHEMFVARLGRAGASSVVGTVGYVSMLALASGSGATLTEVTPQVAVAAAGTAALAMLTVALLTPLRTGRTGLFV